MSDPFMPDQPLPDDPSASPLAIDIDADGQADLVAGDETGDGQADWLATTDESGATVVVIDSDGQPGWDTVVTDLDADGRTDTLIRDLDADGQADVVQADTDADGFLDTTTFADGTSLQVDPATGELVGYQPGSATPAPATPIAAPDGIGLPDATPDDDSPFGIDPVAPAVQPAAPAVDPTPNIHGEFVDDRPFLQTQTEDGFCAPVAVGMVISEFVGRVVPESETVDAAVDLGILTHDADGWSGLTVFETEALVEHFGISAHIEPAVDPLTGNFLDPMDGEEAMDNLGKHLDANHGVILMVDSSEIWTSVDDDGTFSDDGMDHAVVIRQIDEDAGTVTLNDPGNPEGQEWVMSIDDFLEAWDDSGYAMVVTDEAPAAALVTAPADGTPVGGLQDGLKYAGFVILPVVVAADRLRRRSRI